MKKIILLMTCLCQLVAHETYAENSLFRSESNKKVIINNRVLAKVNGKAISVYDLMKKMDLLFYRQFPEYTSSNEARYQFYMANWPHVLRDMVDKELIMADAEEVKMPVSSGDIRQEMESMFGPNIITNLDKVGLSYEEAWAMVKSDITLKRMLYTRANAKAMKKITPIVIRQAYDSFAKENTRPATWTYYVVNIRDKDPSTGAESAHQVHRLLSAENVPLAKIAEAAAQLASVAPSSKITVSEEFQQTLKEMAESNKDLLTALKKGEYSQPSSQKSRSDGSTVYRILYLKDTSPEGAPPFQDVANGLKDKLLDETSAVEVDEYLKRLRKHFDVQGGDVEELEKENFEPFSLR